MAESAAVRARAGIRSYAPAVLCVAAALGLAPHGGRLRATPNDGGGVTMRITMPGEADGRR